MAVWEDRLGLVDELLPDWMKKKNIIVTTPNDCYDFLVKNKVYKKNTNQSKSKSLRDDLRDLEEAYGMPYSLSNLQIYHAGKNNRWHIKIINLGVQSFDEEDDLDRKKVAEKFTSIIFSNAIKNKDHKGLVVALDSSWGTGKTYFIKKWQLMLGEKYQDHTIKSIYYNAWENDDYENALIPIISEIYKCSSEPEIKEIAKKTGKVAVTILGVTARQVIRNKTGIDTKEIADEIQGAVENSVLKEYTEHQNSKLGFKKTLSKLPKENEKIVVFVDELDRCRPQFAIETLESIKHFMNVDKFIFIFSIDMEQLSHSVATLYGQKMDASGYLARFFDIQFRLPTPDISSYTKIMTKDLKEYNKDKVCDILKRIYDLLLLSLRDINHIYDNLNIFLNIYSIGEPKIFDKIEIYTFLISLKYKYPNILRTFFYHVYSNGDSFDTHTIKIISNTRMETGEVIKGFLNTYKIGGLRWKMKQVASESDNIMHNLLGVDNEYYNYYDAQRLDNFNKNPDEKVYEYIERKLEFIDYIKKENE